MTPETRHAETLHGEAFRRPLEFIFVARARAFASVQRRHLGWESGTILPLAERRLNDDDRAAQGAKMAARRGISLPG